MEIWDQLTEFNKGNMPFAAQVALFFRIWPEKSSLKSFFAVQDVHSSKRLKTALQGKYQELAQNREKNKFVNYGISTHRQKPIQVDLLPPELRTEHARLSPLIREISSLHARLFNCTSNAQRLELAAKIIALVKDRRQILTCLDHFGQTGQVISLQSAPEARARPGFEKDYQAEHEIKLLMSQRSKAKKNKRVKEYEDLDARIKDLRKKRL